MSYQADIFVSYRRSATVGRWVRQFLVPLLAERLDENSPTNVQLFIDENIPPGAPWPRHLREMLKRSKLLLPIWSANYFRSSWCMAEWESFRRRERLLNTQGALIYPIAYSGNTYFHPDAKATQTIDFSTLASTEEGFRAAPDWLRFDRLVTTVATDLVTRIQAAPPWRSDFPITEPEPMPDPVMERPRL
ncbi:MAG: hypothetical protein QOG72_432 [Sphingomonadales bacterium]|jgi:hypothetical protein|nr:hypothetical protein [Sphingomonadales bacterium]